MRNIKRFTTPHSFHATVEIDKVLHEVSISTPDLSDNERSSWGDWGPLYTFTLKDNQQIELTYRVHDLVSEQVVRPKFVKLNSPMFFEDRQKWPFCLEFEDELRGLHFLAYLNDEGQVDRTEVKVTYPKHAVSRLLFPEQSESRLSA